jgi:molecular chaperone GrpE (heat shock protein)
VFHRTTEKDLNLGISSRCIPLIRKKPKEVNVQKDQRDPNGRFVKSEIDVLNASKKRMAISNAVLGRPALGNNPIAEPARRPGLQQQLDEAKEAKLHLRAEVDERNSLQRREITRLKKNHQKEIQAFLNTIDQLTDQPSPPSIKSLQI